MAIGPVFIDGHLAATKTRAEFVVKMNDCRQPDTGRFFRLNAGLSEATNAVTAFHPAVVYPCHYRDSSGATVNAAAFKQQLRQDLGVEVRLRKWY